MALTEVQAGVRYVVGPDPTALNSPTHNFKEGDVVTLAPERMGIPDSDGDVKMRTDDQNRYGHYIAIKHLTPEADVAPAATTPEREPGVLLVGDKVKLKVPQERTLPSSLRDYLDANGLTAETAVFTVSAIGDCVEFSEYDTHGGYYPTRFELVAPADATVAERLVEVASLADLRVDDVLQVNDSIPASAEIPAGTRLRVTSVGDDGVLAYATRLDNGVSRTVRDSQLRYVSKVVPTVTPEPTATSPAEQPAPAQPVQPVVGGRLRFTGTYVQGASVNIGDEVEITDVLDDGRIYTVTTHGTGRWLFRQSRGGFEILPRITQDHTADMTKIAAALLSEATTRGGRWPGVYDELVARLNPQLTVKLPERARAIIVDLGPDLGTVTVQASNEAEAKQKVLDALCPLAG